MKPVLRLMIGWLLIVVSLFGAYAIYTGASVGYALQANYFPDRPFWTARNIAETAAIVAVVIGLFTGGVFLITRKPKAA